LDLFFYLIASITLAAALLVVTRRNAVNAAMFLIVTFLGMASLFVLLEAFFLAVVQVLVYAGAVVVLFLFIIMLLDVKGGDRADFRPVSLVAGGLAFVLLVLGLVAITKAPGLAAAPPPGVAAGASLEGFSRALFTTYLLPMQVTGFLLLVAMIGVIVLSKRLAPSPVGPDLDRGPSAADGEQGREQARALHSR
jgi:NADH-quinone oxidoreductase subunit J